MIPILSTVVSVLAFRLRSRASLDLELIALQHQDRSAATPLPASALLPPTRFLSVWLYRVWPQVLNAMVLVKPATVVQWHRKGLWLDWWWRSRRLGRPKMSTEIRDLIRQMSLANPLWGTPRHPRRSAQARHRGQPSHGWEIPAVAAQRPLPDLA